MLWGPEASRHFNQSLNVASKGCVVFDGTLTRFIGISVVWNSRFGNVLNRPFREPATSRNEAYQEYHEESLSPRMQTVELLKIILPSLGEVEMSQEGCGDGPLVKLCVGLLRYHLCWPQKWCLLSWPFPFSKPSETNISLKLCETQCLGNWRSCLQFSPQRRISKWTQLFAIKQNTAVKYSSLSLLSLHSYWLAQSHRSIALSHHGDVPGSIFKYL